jgi:hypothetical protein
MSHYCFVSANGSRSAIHPRPTRPIAASYFQRNLPYMAYDTYLKQGWPIASGVIEGACRHFVKDRCELSGMRWTQPGVQNLLRLCPIAENGDWAAYHQFRKRQQHIRLYGSPCPEPTSLEIQAVEQHPLLQKQSLPTRVRQSGISVGDRKPYHQLPLAG